MHAPIDEDIYRSLFEAAPDATLLIDGDGRICLANAQAEQLFGRPRAELVGAPIESLIPQRFRDAHAGHRRRYVESARIRHMGAGPLLLALRADGSEIPVEISLSPARTVATGFTVASVRDVSEIARTRQAAARGRYNLYIARFGLRAVGDPDFASLIEAAGPLIAEAMQVDAVVSVRLTPDRRECFGVSAYGIADRVPERMRAPIGPSSMMERLMATREAIVVPDLAAQSRFHDLDLLSGPELRSALGVPLFDAGEVIGALTALGRQPRSWSDDDIHFMQSIANTLATALQRATTEERLLHAQRLEALGQLTSGVAHDFNNLLMVISGNLQMLGDVAADRPAALALSRQAINAAERGAMLTRKLLAFARKQPLNADTVDLNHLVTEFRDLVQRTFGEQVSLQLKLEPALPIVVADAAQLETALLNLALNARDAMPQGGVLVLETAEADFDAAHPPRDPDLEPGRYACLRVADSGAGMTPEVLARAIEPFFTTKGAGKGSGLGLSMVYGFARQSGGTLTLSSEPGRGTAATVYLPIPADLPSPKVARHDASAAPGRETLLVVEDQADVLGIAAGFLEQLGYSVLKACDSETALRLLGEHAEIELMFTDISLPGMDGIALAKAARAARPALPVLFSTACLSDAATSRLSPGEIAGLLEKPYLREELASRVRKLLSTGVR